MIKRFLTVYPSIYYAKHTYLAPEIKENTNILKHDLVFNPVKNKTIYLNNKLKNKSSINEIKRVYYFKLWNALTKYNFTLFENIIQQFLNEGYKYDEVIYTLIVHSYILNHKKKKENAYLVIEEMKRAYMHPTIIKINERMINSFSELEMIFCEPSKSLWINICRFIWEISIKLNRERKRKLREQLNLLPPNDVLKLTQADLKIFLKKEYEESLLNNIETVHIDCDMPYDHMMIEESNEDITYDKRTELVQLQKDFHPNEEETRKYLGNADIDMNKDEVNELLLHNVNKNSDDEEEEEEEEEEEKGEVEGNEHMEFFKTNITSTSLFDIQKEENEIDKTFIPHETIHMTNEDLEEDRGDCSNEEELNEQENDILLDENEDFDIQLLKKYFKYK